MGNPLDDQTAARRRAAGRWDSAVLAQAGVPAVVRYRTVWATPVEQAALAAGILPLSLRVQLERQNADDAVIQAMEDAERLPRPAQGLSRHLKPGQSR
jgi:hypothetical protein